MNKITCNIISKKNDFAKNADIILSQIYNINDVTLNIYEDNKMVDKFSNDNLRIDAFMVSYIDKNYVLYVRKGYMDNNILSHEIIHLWQYYRGDLQMVGVGKSYIWKGVEYNKQTDYNDRPWEKEAFKDQCKIKRQLNKLIKSSSK